MARKYDPNNKTVTIEAAMTFKVSLQAKNDAQAIKKAKRLLKWTLDPNSKSGAEGPREIVTIQSKGAVKTIKVANAGEN